MSSRAPRPNKQNHLTITASLCHFHPAGHIITLKATRQLSDCLTNYTTVEWGKLENKAAENKTKNLNKRQMARQKEKKSKGIQTQTQ